MQFNGYIYLFLLTAIFCVTYVILYFLFPFFFEKRTVKLTSRSLFSIICIVLLSFLAYAISYSIPDQALGNRILHAFGGGFLAFLTCFFVARDTKLKLTRFHFFVFSFLIVASLGVANELLEFILQSTTHVIFADSITDTWLDLASNTIGALIASMCFLPLIGRAKK